MLLKVKIKRVVLDKRKEPETFKDILKSYSEVFCVDLTKHK